MQDENANQQQTNEYLFPELNSILDIQLIEQVIALTLKELTNPATTQQS